MTDETPTSDKPAEQSLEMPEVEVIGVQVRTVRTVKVRCPFCGDRHQHEWAAKGSASVRIRVSHCRNHRRRYRIVVGDDGLPEATR